VGEDGRADARIERRGRFGDHRRATSHRVAMTARGGREFWSFVPRRTNRFRSRRAERSIASRRQKLAEKKLSLSPAADKRTLIRRATYDLTGLPPTARKIDAFVDDASPDAFAKVVDRLARLAAYGERWGRYWLDVARYADTKGYLFEESGDTRSATRTATGSCGR
jgi:hypothetical protein